MKGFWRNNALLVVLLTLFLIALGDNFILALRNIIKDETNPRFWFESFQNWQSEFLSVFTIVFLSIFLREKGSPQSKPVDAPNSGTGE